MFIFCLMQKVYKLLEKIYNGFVSKKFNSFGVIKVGSSLVPFSNKFPKDTKLYKLMTTKLEEQ